MKQKLKTQLNEALDKILDNVKFDTPKTSIDLDINDLLKKEVKQKPRIVFSTLAWSKTMFLVQKMETEIGWQGLVERRGDYEYYIKDIILYPQIVSAATVNTDDEAIALWYSEMDDETFNTMRMHGHSHVNMGTSPSGTDLDMYQKYLKLINGEDFYIFMIFNKKMQASVILYDLKTNIKYETDDVSVIFAGVDFQKWFAEEKEKHISKPTYVKPSPATQKKINASVSNDWPEEDWRDWRRIHGGRY